jgi:hypothetical protein
LPCNSELRYTDSRGRQRVVTFDVVIAGCDGFHGIWHPATPGGGLATVTERGYCS